jgi:hypothetical protein
MNLKSLFGLKATSDLSSELHTIAERVSTAAGCQSLAEELEQQRQAEQNMGPRASLLRRQIDELSRLQKGHAIAEDRARVAAVVKRDTDAASKTLKAAESKLKAANEASKQAASALADRVVEIDQLRSDLAELHAAADTAVEIASKGFADAFATVGVSVEGEAAAFDAVKNAQAHRATCGDFLAARIKVREADLGILQKASRDAESAVSDARDDINRARLQLARVEYDQAAQLLVDAFIKARAIRSTDSAGRSFSMSTLHNLELAFADPERAVNGAQLIGESGRVRDWVMVDMIKTFAPADLELLSAGLPAPKQVEEPLDLPNPNLYLDGSTEHMQATIDLQKATKHMGAEEAESVRNRLWVQASLQRKAQTYEPLAR